MTEDRVEKSSVNVTSMLLKEATNQSVTHIISPVMTSYTR